MTTSATSVDAVLGLGDDALVTAQRLGWWISRAPELEEDVALANIGLDQLGQARALLAHAGSLEGAGRSADDLAYLRGPEDFRNVLLVERPQQDFGVAMVRMLLLAAWQLEVYAALAAGADPVLAGVAAKAVKEVDYHLDHASTWVLRLGDGTEESHRRAQAALDAEWPYLAELLRPDSGACVDPATLAPAVLARATAVLDAATLTVPDVPPAGGGGRRGDHTEHLADLLAEMQQVARAHPGASW
ncbi:1,2-phenylacetyl-CoA epoxidase subunit PaaC [Nocardioides sp. SYSU DS0663]|uniref:1,2-phenylacetyl-CoA epoxidase subunit PaaC n=1 Tax=Nocardioides sp. SYSU DS0663 TaxID=3416445 RepID=UPI003F4C9643